MSKRYDSHTMAKKLGINPDTGFVDIPTKFSNVQLSRIKNGELMGCSFCFPHGVETINNKWTQDLRCWKRYRKFQYRDGLTKRIECATSDSFPGDYEVWQTFEWELQQKYNEEAAA